MQKRRNSILIWPKSPYKHIVIRSYRSGKESGRRSESPLWRHQWRSFVFISHADDVKREIRLYISRLLTNQKRESALGMGYIYIYIFLCICNVYYLQAYLTLSAFITADAVVLKGTPIGAGRGVVASSGLSIMISRSVFCAKLDGHVFDPEIQKPLVAHTGGKALRQYWFG